MTWETWKTEADMVADFTVWATREGWIVYAETAGWDLLLVRGADGFQIGVEAKLSLNATVLCQVISREHRWSRGRGPDCRAILVPRAKAVNGLADIAKHLGVVVVTGAAPDQHHYREPKWAGPIFEPDLPVISGRYCSTDDELSRDGWPELCPDERCTLPEYLPDVTGGKAAPVQLTPWKIQAIKAAILLETRGYITRADFKALKLDASRWTQYWLKSTGDKRWVSTPHTPDFRAQHPVNYEQIKADMPKWSALLPPVAETLPLTGGA